MDHLVQLEHLELRVRVEQPVHWVTQGHRELKEVLGQQVLRVGLVLLALEEAQDL